MILGPTKNNFGSDQALFRIQQSIILVPTKHYFRSDQALFRIRPSIIKDPTKHYFESDQGVLLPENLRAHLQLSV